MATVSKSIAEEIIAKNGYYDGDPRVREVLKYTSMNGEECYALIYQSGSHVRDYEDSPYCFNVTSIWKAT